MTELIFDLQLFAPDGPGGDSPGGGGTSSSVSWSAANSITAETTTNNQTYTSTTADENAVLISTTGTVTINDATVNKSGGTSAEDNYSFYGINSAVMCMGGGTTSIIGGTVTTSAAGANGIFSYGANSGQTNATGDGTTVYIKDTSISTSAQGSGGIMTTFGGTTIAENLTITTDGGSSAPIRTDRGGGWVTVTGGSYTSNGLGSPAIYSTADVKVNDATLISNQSEGVCIEGAGSIALSNCTLTANNTNTNGNATFKDSIMIYQSMSGDASDGTSTFSMTSGTLNSQNGHVFHVTNTTAVINLSNVTINNSDSDGVLLSVCDDGWSGNSNVATLNAANQTLNGNILVGDDSTLTLNLEGSTFKGNIRGEITNASGGTVSSEVGTVNVVLDAGSKWYLTGDTYITNFSGDAANIISDGYALYVNGTALDGTTTSEGTGLTINNSINATLLSGTNFDDSIQNSGSEVTIDAGLGNDTINNSGANVTIDAGAGNNFVMNNSSVASNVSIVAGAGNDLISNSGSYVTIQSAGGNDSVFNSANSNALISLGSGNDTINNIMGANASIDAGDGNNFIVNSGANVTVNAGSGNDTINNVRAGANISTGEGDDYITNTASDVTIDAGTGNDTISGVNSTTNIVAAVTSYKIDDDNVILTTDDGTLTILNGASETFLLNGVETIFTAADSTSDSETALNITNNTNNTVINGTDYNDTITNSGDNVTINAGAGDDSIENEGENVIIYGGAGNDTIGNIAQNVTIDGGLGDEVIANVGANISIFGSAGGDSILNLALGTNSTIDGSAGEDTLENNAQNVMVYGGDDADTIANSSLGANSTLVGGTGGDSIENNASNVLILGGDDDDSIGSSNALNVTIDGGNGDDIIVNSLGANSTIIGGDGNDTIINEAENAIIYGNAGNDLIYNGNSNVTINAGTGNDSISGVNSTTNIVASVTNSSVDGDNVILTTSDGTLTILHGASETFLLNGVETIFTATDSGSETALNITNNTDNTLISGTNADDSIINRGNNVTIDAGAGNDVVGNYGTNIMINGGAGNDSILNQSLAANATISGGAGNDNIENAASNVIISGGDGNDNIANINASVSIDGGAGNDSIFNDANSVSISGGDGADFISNFGGYSTLNGGAGNDSIFNYTGNVTIDAGEGANVVYNTGESVLINVGSGNSTINNSATNVTINADGSNAIVYNSSDSVLINAGAGNDSILNYGGNSTVSGGDGADYIVNDAATNVIINGGDGADSIDNSSDNVSISGGSGNDLIQNTGNNSTITGDSGDDVIVNSGNGVSMYSGEGNDTLYNNEPGTNSTITGGSGDNSIVNEAANVIIDGGDGDDIIQNSGTSVTILASAGNDTISGVNSTTNIVASVTNSSINGDNVILTTSDGTLTILNGASETFLLNGVETIFTAADSDSDSSVISNLLDNTLVSGTDSADSITNYGAQVTIDARAGNDTIVNDELGINSTINGGTGADYIENSAANVAIDAGEGNDTIGNFADRVSIDGGNGANVIANDSLGTNSTLNGGSGNDTIANHADSVTINAGAGNDSISNSGENVTIDAGEGNDSIQNAGESVSVSGGAGNDYVLNLSNNVTIDGGADNDDLRNGGENVLISGGAGNDSIFNHSLGANSTIDGGADDDNINNYAQNVNIDGGDGNDAIYNEGNNSTLNAGAGADSIANFGESVSIDTGADADNINNYAANVTIDAGEGADLIYNDSVGTNSTVNGGAGDDFISNFADTVMIDAGEGNDTIAHSGADSTLNGGAGDDAIITGGKNILIDAGDGNDSIANAAPNTSINAGAGNDRIENTGSDVSIVATEGDNYIYNSGTSVTISTGDGNDVILNHGYETSINAGNGNNSIKSTFDYTRTGAPDTVGPGTTIIAGSGNDSVFTTRVDGSLIDVGEGDNYLNLDHSYNNTIQTGAGNDTLIVQRGASVTAYTGDGDDIIGGDFAIYGYDWTFGGRAMIDGGAGNDFISPYYSNLSSIYGGEGDDTLINNGANTTLNGGPGNDLIWLTYLRKDEATSIEPQVIVAGEGNDTLMDFSDNTTIVGALDSASIDDEDNVILTGNDGSLMMLAGAGYFFNLNGTDTIFGSSIISNSADDTLLTGSKYADTITNSGSNVTIDAGAGNDLISNSGENVTILSSAGDDSISGVNSSTYIQGAFTSSSVNGDNVILTGANGTLTVIDGAGETFNLNGNDTVIGGSLNINNSFDGVLVSGSKFADTITNSGSNVTINAGAGDDRISNTGANVTILSSAGKDTISGVNSTTYIQAAVTDSTVDGHNVVLTTSDGTLTILNGAGETFNLNGNETVIGSLDSNSTLAAQIADWALHKTAAGYPVLAGIAFHPEENAFPPPTNYYTSETWTATSADDLKLYAAHYSPENPTGRWVILVHGYGHAGAGMNAFAAPYLAQGVDVLVIDQRAAGNSEGEWLTMGVAESADLAIWTQEIANTNSNAQITLHGVSMGAATVMLAAALSQTTNVTAMIEDCGYGDITAVLTTLLENYGSVFGYTGDVPTLVDEVMGYGEALTNYDVAKAAPLDSIAQVTVPSLFIHGAEDQLIPVSVANEMYEKVGADDKTLVVIPGAGHGYSGLVDSATYLEAVVTLLNESTQEIGASINSADNSKLIRGTIYDDTISASGSNVTIDGVSGNDTVSYSSGMKVKFDATNESLDGEDVILTNDTSSVRILGAKLKSLTLIDSDGNETTTILGGESLMSETTINGLVYTPVDSDASVVYDSDGAVTGIVSGTVEVTTENSTGPKITLDGSTPFNFTATAAESDTAINMAVGRSSITYSAGEITYSADKATLAQGTVGVIGTVPIIGKIDISADIPASGLEIPIGANVTTVTASETVTTTITGSGNTSGTISFNGTVSYDNDNRQFTLSKGGNLSADVSALGMINLDFAMSAISDTTFGIDGTNIVIKDGAAIHLDGKTFGINGDLALSGGDLSMNLLQIVTTGAVRNWSIGAGATVSLNLNDMLPVSITAPETASATISNNGKVYSITTSDDNGLNISVGELEGVSVNVKGTVKLDGTNGNLITLTKDTVLTATLPDGSVAQVTAKDDDSANITLDGSVFTVTPEIGDGTLQVVLKNANGEEIFDTELDVTAGSVSYDYVKNAISIAAGSSLKATVDDYIFTVSNAEEISGTFEFGASGTTITPTSDAEISLTVAKGSETIFDSVTLKATGAFTFGEKGALSVAQGSELNIKFSDTYSVKFKVTDTAGGTFALTDAGLAYTPNSDDGDLEMTVTNGSTVRTTTLSVTGTVTYELGGDIALAKGTVVTNTFADGVVLKFTATEDASGKINFQESDGLTVTDENSNLNLEMKIPSGATFNIDSITGKLTYQNAKVTLYEGTNIHILSNSTLEQTFSVDSGTAILDYSEMGSDPEMSYLTYGISDNGSLTVKTANVDKTMILNGGTIKSGTNIQLLEPGVIIYAAAGDSGTGATTFSLDGNGEYTVNGFKVNVSNIDLHDKTHYGTAIRLIDNKAIAFTPGTATISYNDTDYTGDTTVYITEDAVSYILYNSGTYNLGGKTFVLTEDVSAGVTVSAADSSVTVSHIVTEAEMITDPTGSPTEIGKVLTEKATITGDETYTISTDSTGVKELQGISNGATVRVTGELEGAPAGEIGHTWFNVVTDEEGTITLDDTAIEIAGDSEVTLNAIFSTDFKASLGGVSGLEGVIGGDLNNLAIVNGNNFSISGGASDAALMATSSTALISGINENATVTSAMSSTAVSTKAEQLKLNNDGYTVTNDSDGVVITSDREIVGLDNKASLQVANAGNYTVNNTPIEANAGDVIIGVNENYAYIHTSNAAAIDSDTSSAEILDILKADTSDAEYMTDTDSYTVDSSDYGRNAVVIPDTATSAKVATLSDKGDIAVVEATSAPVTVNGGKGNDTLVTAGDDVTFDMAAGGNDKVIATAGNVKLENYDALSVKGGVELTNEDIATGVTFDEGKVNLANATVELDNNFVNFYNAEGATQKVGFATSTTALVDASNSSADLVLVGGGSALANTVEGASLLSGSGNDLIIAGKGSYINAGSGSDYVQMSNDGGSTVRFNSGVTTIDNLNFANNSSAADADTVDLGNASITKVVVDNGTVALKTSTGRVKISAAENQDFKLAQGGQTVTAQVGDTNVNYDGVADVYFAAGKNASVTVGDISASSVDISLADTSQFDGDFKYIDASAYTKAATLTGNERYNVIKASAGGSVIRGGLGNDTLVGGNGADTFMYELGDGKDTIVNLGTTDTVNTNDAAISKVDVDGNDVILKFNDGGQITMVDAAGQDFHFANNYTTNSDTVTAQVAKSELNYDGTANYYWATGKNASVKVGNISASEVEIWLDNNENSDARFNGNIKYLDASSYSGKATLVGNENNNVITAGSNGSSLWGGNSTSNDTLIGGDGADLFWYSNGNGNDVIVGAGSNDTVNLSGITLDQISAKSTDTSLKLNFSSGGSLTLDTNNGTTFVIGDTSYTYSKTDKQFNAK